MAQFRQADSKESDTELLHLLFKNITDYAILVLTPDGNIVSSNAGAERIKGYAADEIVGRHFSLFYPPESIERGWPDRALSNANATGRFEDEGWRIKKDGTPFWANVVITALHDQQGTLRGFSKITRDLTARKQEEERLRVGEERYRLAAEAVQGLIYDFDVRAKVVHRSAGLEDLLGYRPDEVPATGDWWHDRIHPDDLPRLRLEATVAGNRRRTEYRVRHRDGHWVHVRDHSVIERDANGDEIRIVGNTMDVTELRVSEAFARQVSELAPSVMYVYDLVRKQNVWGNRGMFDGLGYSREQLDKLSGNLLEELMHPDDFIRYSQHAARLLAIPDGEAAEFEYRMRAADGSWRWLVSRDMVFLRAEDGQVTQIVGAALDITDRKQAEAALQEADRRKNEFLATLAHELRNPLAPIRNGLQILKLVGDDPVAAEQSRAVMERQVEQMTRLIDDLMDVSRISQGKIQLQKKRVLLADAIRNAVETSRPLIEARGHEFVMTVPSEPIYVEGDLIRLAQVFANLLNNAAKYTDEGGRIRLAVEQRSNDAVVRVSDNGVGIPDQMLSRVFEMFAQVNSSLEKSQGGLGIGLNIVRRLVEKHGGSVAVESDGPGLGSTFTVRLPVIPACVEEPMDLGDASSRNASRLRILIVDDNRDAANSLSMMLRIMGNETQTAYDGQEAVATAEKFQPAVILMDIGMPKLNGYEACRRIREQSWGKRIIFVACTGWGQEDDKRKSGEAGFDLHVTKPVDALEVAKILRELSPLAE